MSRPHLLLAGLWDFEPSFRSGGQRAFWELALTLCAEYRITVVAFLRAEGTGRRGEKSFTARNPVGGGELRILRTDIDKYRGSRLDTDDWDIRVVAVRRSFRPAGILTRGIAPHLVLAQPSLPRAALEELAREREWRAVHIWTVHLSNLIECFPPQMRSRCILFNHDSISRTVRQLHENPGFYYLTPYLKILRFFGSSLLKLERSYSEKFGRVLYNNFLDREFLGLGNACFVEQALAEPAGPLLKLGDELLIFANLRHYPNFDALQWLLREIEPGLDPAIKVRIVGLDRPVDLLGREKARTIEVQSYVRDLDSVWSNAFMVFAPHRIGGGASMKALDARSRGVPVLLRANHGMWREGLPGVRCFAGNADAAALINDTYQRRALLRPSELAAGRNFYAYVDEIKKLAP